MSSDDELISDLNSKIENLYLEYRTRTGKDVKSLMNSRAPKAPKRRDENDSSEEEEVKQIEEVALPKPVVKIRPRVNSDITYTAVVGGKEKTFKYRTSLMRAKFHDVQRDEYKKECKEKGMDFINEMFLLLANFFWKVQGKNWIGTEEDLITTPMSLLNWYQAQPKDVQDEIFRKKPYYKNYIK